MVRRVRGWLKGQWFFRVKRVLVWRLVRRDGGLRCSYCACTFLPKGNRQRTLDHRVARACGGARWRLANLVFACAACNRRKATDSEDEFLASVWLEQRRTVLAHEAQVLARRVASV